MALVSCFCLRLSFKAVSCLENKSCGSLILWLGAQRVDLGVWPVWVHAVDGQHIPSTPICRWTWSLLTRRPGRGTRHFTALPGPACTSLSLSFLLCSSSAPTEGAVGAQPYEGVSSVQKPVLDGRKWRQQAVRCRARLFHPVSHRWLRGVSSHPGVEVVSGFCRKHVLDNHSGESPGLRLGGLGPGPGHRRPACPRT